MLENFKSVTSQLTTPHPVKEGKSSKIMYLITVKTGSMKYAGTDSNVDMALTGASGERSSLVRLDNAFRDDFERSKLDKFSVKLEDVGRPVILTLKHAHGGMFSDWFVVSATVQKLKDPVVFHFPINMWISGTTQVAVGTAKVPQHEENPILVTFRRQELEMKRLTIKWKSSENADSKGFTGCIEAESAEDIPRNLQLDYGMPKNFNEVKKQSGKDAINKLERFSEMQAAFIREKKLKRLKEASRNWDQDEAFGRQLLNGCNSNLLRRCLVIPKKFPVTHKMVESQLSRGISLEEEVKKGHVYIIDLEILEGLTCGRNPVDQSSYFAAVPMCLLYVNCKKSLVPIAIQLLQKPAKSNPVWTPDDGKWDWMLAKMYFRNAEMNAHMVLEKIFRTHFVLEPFAIALHRCLSSRHPVFKLLLPHLRYVVGGNFLIRATVLNPGGIFDKLYSYGGGSQNRILRAALEEFSVDDLNIRNLFKKNKTDDTNLLPGYHYRDDASALWIVIERFVDRVLSVFYTSNKDLEKDEELKGFLKEISHNGFLSKKEDKKDLSAIKDINRLTELITSVIFTSSCRQASVTSGFLETTMLVPNAPLGMRLPPPTEKGKTSLADYPSLLFIEEAVQNAISALKEDLQQLSTQFRARNEASGVQYETLLPEKISFAISL